MLASNFVVKLVNLSSYKASCKRKTLNFALKIPYLAIFRLEPGKTIVVLDFTTFSLLKCNISFKKDFFKFRTKFVLFGCFWAGTRKYYCTVIFYISTLKFFQTQNFVQKQKSLNPGPKLAQLGILGWNFKKII